MTLNTIEEVRALKWDGNFAADFTKFDAVNQFILREPDLAKRQEADMIANLAGMGQDVSQHYRDHPEYDPRDHIFNDQAWPFQCPL